MAKKRFIAGMESLFGDLEETSNFEQQASAISAKPAPKKRPEKSSGKGFRDDLKAYLQEAFEESLEQQLEQKKEERQQDTPKSRPRGGLDALLRSTIEPTKIRLENKPIRRLTIAFDEQKLDKLKQIARTEKIYLKDIIDEIVSEYIDGYEAQRGTNQE